MRTLVCSRKAHMKWNVARIVTRHYLQLFVEFATEAIKHGQVERAKVRIEAVQI